MPKKYANTRVCSRHFVSGKLKRVVVSSSATVFKTLLGKPSPLYNETNPDWAPTLLLGGAPEPCLSTSRYERTVQRAKKRKRQDTDDTFLSSMVSNYKYINRL